MSHRRSIRRRGAAAAELAVVSPILVALLLAIAEFGSVLFVRHTMIEGARAGARQLAIQGATTAQAIQIAEDYLEMSNLTGATVTAQNAFAGSGDDAEAREIWVQIDLPIENASIVGDALNLFGDGDTLTTRSTMRKEGQLIAPPAS